MQHYMTCLQAVEVVLLKAHQPLGALEILRSIQDLELTEISGRTPTKTINARISVDISNKGKRSAFRRVAPGRYTLNAKTLLEAVAIVLTQVDKALSAADIEREIGDRQLIQMRGDTRRKTINARISEDISRRGDASQFKRVGRALYTLRDQPGIEYRGLPRRKLPSPKSSVLVFPATVLDDLGYFHGIQTQHEPYVEGILRSDAPFWLPRPEAEADPRNKQVISYIMVVSGDSVLRYTRGRFTSIQSQIEDVYSIGFGGHIERGDWSIFSWQDHGFQSSVARELYEEIGLAPTNYTLQQLKLVGVLNDNSTELGRCHFAFLQMLELPHIGRVDNTRTTLKKSKLYPEQIRHAMTIPFVESLSKGEMSVKDMQLIKVRDLAREFGKYEYWSQLCIQALFPGQLALECYIDRKSETPIIQEAQIVCVVGYIGSGKSEAAKLFAQEFGYVLVSVSSVLKQLLGNTIRSGKGERSELQSRGLEFVNRHNGHRDLARAIVDLIRNQPGIRYVVDGLRFPETLTAIEELVTSRIAVIYIEATVDHRYQYYKSREAKDASFEEFLSVVYHRVERHIERFRPRADITIFNFGTRDGFLDKMRSLLKRELTGYGH